MKGNAGCDLPCWWGITPGLTAWSEARQFLEQFSIIERASSSMSMQPDSTAYVAFFPNPDTDDSNGALLTVADGIVQTIRIDPETSRFGFTLDRLLSAYGTPSSVLVRRATSYSQDYLSFTVVLLYQDEHFLAQFHFSAPKSESPLRPCLAYGPHIDIWSPAEAWTPSWIQRAIEYDNHAPFMTLEHAAGIDSAGFQSMFKDRSTNQCFQLKAAE